MAKEDAALAERAKVGTFVYFSDLLSRTVVDAQGVSIGRLWDLSIRLPEPYPFVRQLLIRPRGQTDLLLVAEGSQVRSWTADPIPLTARPGPRSGPRAGTNVFRRNRRIRSFAGRFPARPARDILTTDAGHPA